MDIFKSDAFSTRTLTDAINKLPFKAGRIGELQLFEEKGTPTTTVAIEERQGVLYLVPTAPRGAPATQNQKAGRKLHGLECVHLPVSDRIQADEIQNVRAFGTEGQLKAITTETNDRLATMTQSLEMTLEFMRAGAVKGEVLDADGTTPLFNMFTIFGISPYSTVNFDLEDMIDTDSGAIREKCHGVTRNIEDALGATPYDHVHAFCGAGFMDQLVKAEECKRAYDRWQEGQALRESFARRTFAFAGVLFEEYRGSIGGSPFFASEEVRFFPVGAPGVFVMRYGPANYVSDVNMPGRPLYAKAVPDLADRWIDLMAQSNPLPLCTRPKCLIQGIANT